MESLKPQDVLVVLKLCSGSPFVVAPPPPPGFAFLAMELGLSSSEVHAAIRRAGSAGLLRPSGEPPSRKASVRRQPNTTGVIEFLVHGLKYVFPPHRGELTRGVPTSYAAAPLKDLIAGGDDPVPVWPFSEGTVRGVSFEPLYRTVPFAALRDPRLYELLALADALRDGRARERKLAEKLLRQRLERPGE